MANKIDTTGVLFTAEECAALAWAAQHTSTLARLQIHCEHGPKEYLDDAIGYAEKRWALEAATVNAARGDTSDLLGIYQAWAVRNGPFMSMHD
jgi:hypothetical protein